jgi:CO/xanthine dehydrogenase Mo-binding subunit
MNSFSKIGKSIPRVDSKAKSMGKIIFISDITRPEMLYAKLLLSDRPHARIVNIDIGEAQALAGVHAIITAEDAPSRHFGLYLQDRLIFPQDVVRYVGEPVAAVAAESLEIAETAVKKIRIKYEDLPPIFSVEDALKDDAPLLHPSLEYYSGIHDYIKSKNVCMDARLDFGDVEKGFSDSDHIFEEVYRSQGMHQASLEPHSCLADHDIDGRITIWTGTQQLSVCHKEIATALDLPMTQVRVIPAWIGGGFGGKLKSQFEPIVALLAKKAKRPVKLTLTREEEFLTARPRAPFKVKIKTGVSKDGLILAREVDILADCGAYADHVIGTATHSITISQGPYRIQNCKARARVIYTNNRDWGCMRGYGAPQVIFAIESQMDQIAAALGIDPADFRLRNIAQEGDSLLTTQPFLAVRAKETLLSALEASKYSEKKNNMGQNQGIGIATSLVLTGLLSSSAIVRVNEDATVSVITSVTDIGTGTHTVLGQIVSEKLGIPFENVTVACMDSDTSPYDTGSIASRTTYDSGNAVRIATEDLIQKLIDVAAESWSCGPTRIRWETGKAILKEEPYTCLTFNELVDLSLFVFHGPLVGQGSWLAAKPWDRKVGEGYGEAPYGTFMYGAHVVEVEVDPSTGKVEILNYTACHDVGRALNPMGIEGQIDGGVAQGIGFALLEEMLVEKGRLINPNFTDYRVPTSLDIPRVKSIIDEAPDPTGPYGAKGIGEPPIIPPAAAIANAIFDATGVRVKSTPFNQEKLYFHCAKKSSINKKSNNQFDLNERIQA